VLSQYVEHDYATQLLSAAPSGVGYLIKDRVSRIDEFIDALNRVAAGGTALEPSRPSCTSPTTQSTNTSGTSSPNSVWR
jgi:DNA-binding NarL/FixJ family response regulator